MIDVQVPNRVLRGVLGPFLYTGGTTVCVDPGFDFHGVRETVLWLESESSEFNYVRKFAHPEFVDLCCQDIQASIDLGRNVSLYFEYFLPFGYDAKLFSAYGPGYILVALGMALPNNVKGNSVLQHYTLDQILNPDLLTFNEKKQLAKICALTLPIPKPVHESRCSPYLFYLHLLGVPVEDVESLALQSSRRWTTSFAELK